ncbi:MAG: acetyl-CoA carboxylase biotin carboxylase subunit [Streptosporangiales bacterium]|nr:acetyl-CoA carboxylase biotin carboxylase subunit [Streptosporangiales bacterium]
MGVSRVLVANRGEIAVRIIRACRSLGLQTVAAVSDADRESMAAHMADRVVCIGPARSTESYLNVGALVVAAQGTGADALHPGYGFLAESAELAVACAVFGITFVGPSPEHIRQLGNKLEAREMVRNLGVPTLPGSRKVHTIEEAKARAAEIGYPILFKAASGGGGRGIKTVSEPGALPATFEMASAEARAAFGDDTLYVERYVPDARHIEVQVLGDRFGHAVHLGERDCSLQRRYQKVVEEAPAACVPPAVREEIRVAGATVAAKLGYESAGTIEFIYDQDSERFYFLEMNTRIQVEHPVTEMLTGLDLVGLQLAIADGGTLPVSQSDVVFQGHAIECRVTAESTEDGFRPSPGRITDWEPPRAPGVRVDTHCYPGYVVPPFYDSLLAKLIVHGADRAEALARMREALASFVVRGVDTTIPFLRDLLNDPDFEAGNVNTRWIEEKKLGRA